MKSPLLLLLFIATFSLRPPAQAQTTQLLGVAYEGGASNAGTIFKTNGNGDFPKVVYQFTQIDGKYPGRTALCEGPDGKLYGLTNEGGTYDDGILYSYDPETSEFLKLLDFEENETGQISDNSLLCIGSKLYGTATDGGLDGRGVLFEYDLEARKYTKKIDFDSDIGSSPRGKLILGENGKLYGTTSLGGPNSYGIIYEYDLETETHRRLAFFGAGFANDIGKSPVGWLTEIDGRFYGMTNGGGSNEIGALFEYDYKSGSISKKVNLTAETGYYPEGGLTIGPDGNFYGMTSEGGSGGGGTIFQYNPATEVYTVKFNFENDSELGYSPADGLMVTEDGTFYGMTKSGGINDDGVIFEFDPATNDFTVKHHFDRPEGRTPSGHLVRASDGEYYGLTVGGGTGTYGFGVLFSFDPEIEEFDVKFDFQSAPKGRNPVGGLLKASNDKLYGVTEFGGAYDQGILYEFDPYTWSLTKLMDFESSTTGKNPSGALMQADDGFLYGTTNAGGTNFNGVLYQFDPVENSFRLVHHFYEPMGRTPYGQLLQARDGKLYGMTTAGAYASGVLYSYDPADETYETKATFNRETTGSTPMGSLMEASNGNLYGLTVYGGSEGKGVLFEYDIETEAYTVKFQNFSESGGYNPYGNLVEDAGKLYGMTQMGGDSNLGVLFSYDLENDTYNKEVDFNGDNGSTSYGSLMKALDGKLYGTTANGGAHDLGVMFQFDPETGSFDKKFDFSATIGANPNYANLLEIEDTNPTINSVVEIATNPAILYPNPNNGIVNLLLPEGERYDYVTITDLSGRLIKRYDITENDIYSFDLPHTAGIYLVLLQKNNGKFVQLKVVKY